MQEVLRENRTNQKEPNINYKQIKNNRHNFKSNYKINNFKR